MSSAKTHPVSQTDLLLYAEGELTGNACSRMRTHILDCTGCQAELQNLQDGIKTLIQLHNDYALAVPAPPRPWEPIDTQIEIWEKRWKTGFLFDGLRALLHPRYSSAALAAALLAVACFILQPWYETVSANELLVRATVAQSKNLSSAHGSIIHQRLQIVRKSREHGREWENDKTISYESWLDDSRNHFRENSSSAEMSGELERIYQANHLDWKSPLSAAAYERWQSSLPEKQDSVARSSAADFTLTTLAGNNSGSDAIEKAQFVIRAADWLPITLRLWLGDREYEIHEVNAESLSPSQINPSLFDVPAATRHTAVVVVKQSPGSRRMEGISAPVLTAPAASSPELTPVELSKPSAETPAQVSASEQGDVVQCNAIRAAAPVTSQNVPDAPNPILETTKTTSLAPVWTAPMTALGGSIPRSHNSSEITLSYQPSHADRRGSGFETHAITVAPLLVPNIIKPRPFKAFESSTVVVTSPQSRNPIPCPFKALGNKLGIVKQKKTEPPASDKPGG